jgi:2-oxo-3-(phosphooxy)propyl 3-oxoalkanoate synthase
MVEATDERSVDLLGFEQTVPASLVHKHALEQVFITDWMKGPTEDVLCTIAAQLPLAHARFSDGTSGYHDLLCIAEVVRQGGLISAAKVLEIPADRQFLLRELRVAIDPLERNRRVPECSRMLISQDASRSAVKMRRGGNVAGGKMHARLSIGGEPSGMCEVVGLWLPDEMYSSFRGSAGGASNGAGEPADDTTDLSREPEPASGKGPANTAVGTLEAIDGEPRGYRGALLVDQSDATFFDHPLDHIPGLLMLEAMQQSAVAAVCRERSLESERVAVRSLDVTFSRIAELTPGASCRVTLDAACEEASVELVQSGKVCCAGTIGTAAL